jgi:hypothetical protein
MVGRSFARVQDSDAVRCTAAVYTAEISIVKINISRRSASTSLLYQLFSVVR